MLWWRYGLSACSCMSKALFLSSPKYNLYVLFFFGGGGGGGGFKVPLQNSYIIGFNRQTNANPIEHAR